MSDSLKISRRVRMRKIRPDSFPTWDKRDLPAARKIGAWLRALDPARGSTFDAHLRQGLAIAIRQDVADNLAWASGPSRSELEGKPVEELLELPYLTEKGELQRPHFVREAFDYAVRAVGYSLYQAMISSSGEEQEAAALALAEMVNVIGENGHRELMAQRNGSHSPVPFDRYDDLIYHGLFDGLVLDAILFRGGDKGRCIWFSPARNYCLWVYASAYRDRDLKEDNATTDALQRAINPIPLGDGLVLDFSVATLIEYGSFKMPPFERGEQGEARAFEHVSLNALHPTAKGELVKRFKLPLSFIREIRWMDEEWKL